MFYFQGPLNFRSIVLFFFVSGFPYSSNLLKERFSFSVNFYLKTKPPCPNVLCKSNRWLSFLPVMWWSYTQIIFSVFHDSACRSSEETIGQHRAESDHLDLSAAADAPVPLTASPKARQEGHKSDNGETTSVFLSLDPNSFLMLVFFTYSYF